MKAIIRKLKAKEAQMAKLRDELREMESEIADRADCVERAMEDIQRAIDALSELV